MTVAATVQSWQPETPSLTTATTATTGDIFNKLIDCRRRPVVAVVAVEGDWRGVATTARLGGLNASTALRLHTISVGALIRGRKNAKKLTL